MYTEKEEEYLRQHYTGDNVEQLAIALDKKERSIISKLSTMKLYQKKPYLTKTGEKPIRKLELVAEIAGKLGYDPQELEGMEKTPKMVLMKIVKRL